MSPLGKFLLENCYVTDNCLYVASKDVFRWYLLYLDYSSFERSLDYAKIIGIEIDWYDL